MSHFNRLYINTVIHGGCEASAYSTYSSRGIGSLVEQQNVQAGGIVCFRHVVVSYTLNVNATLTNATEIYRVMLCVKTHNAQHPTLTAIVRHQPTSCVAALVIQVFDWRACLLRQAHPHAVDG